MSRQNRYRHLIEHASLSELDRRRRLREERFDRLFAWGFLTLLVVQVFMLVVALYAAGLLWGSGW